MGEKDNPEKIVVNPKVVRTLKEPDPLLLPHEPDIDPKSIQKIEGIDPLEVLEGIIETVGGRHQPKAKAVRLLFEGYDYGFCFIIG